MEQRVSGVGVIDKSFAVLDAVASSGPVSLSEMVELTSFHKATAHRLAGALEVHGMIRRQGDGRYVLGYRWLEFASKIDASAPLVDVARPSLAALAEETGESAQLYVRDGSERVCVAVSESGHGLRTIVPVGSRLTLALGSAAKVLRGETPEIGFVVSAAEREPGVASVSAPVLDLLGQVVAAVSISGPLDRMTNDPAERFGPTVAATASNVSADLVRSQIEQPV